MEPTRPKVLTGALAILDDMARDGKLPPDQLQAAKDKLIDAYKYALLLASQ